MLEKGLQQGRIIVGQRRPTGRIDQGTVQIRLGLLDCYCKFCQALLRCRNGLVGGGKSGAKRSLRFRLDQRRICHL